MSCLNLNRFCLVKFNGIFNDVYVFYTKKYKTRLNFFVFKFILYEQNVTHKKFIVQVAYNININYIHSYADEYQFTKDYSVVVFTI